MLILFRRAVFAWLIADGDMHMKNLALLKIAEAGAGQFREVRMAPVYDAVTTRFFPRLENDRMALKLNGKDNNLRKSDFRKLAATAGMKAGDADEILADMSARLAQGVDQLRLPELSGYHADSAGMKDRMLDIVRARLESVA